MRLYRVVLMALVVLPGCQSATELAMSEPMTRNAQALQKVEPAIGFDLQPIPPPSPREPIRLPPPPRRKPAGVARQDVALTAPPPPPISPNDLVGLTFVQVVDLLGTPTLQADDPPAKIYAYTGEKCTLKMYFYLDLENDEYRTLTYEVKGGKAKDGEANGEEAEDAAARCLSEIMDDGTRQPARG